MNKYIRPERGNTLMLVLGFIVVVGFMVAPLAMQTNIGLLQAKTSANSETAFTQAHSAYTVFGRLYENLKNDTAANPEKYTKEDILQIYHAIEAMPAFSDVEFEWIEADDGIPLAVVFSSESGAGNQIRESALRYQIDAMPIIPVTPSPVPTPTPDPVSTPTPSPTVTPTATPSPSPVPTPTEPVISGENLVIQNKSSNNHIFARCPAVPNAKFINNSYNELEFRNEYGYYADYYLDTLFVNKTAGKLASASALNNKISEASALVINQSGNGVSYAGNVTVTGTGKAITIAAKSDGTGIQSNGNLDFTDIISSATTVNGKVNVGGNLSVREVRRNGGTLTFGGDVYVRGNVDIGTGGHTDPIVVKGNLVIGGNLIFHNSLKSLRVEGDLIIGGNMTNDQSSAIVEWTVLGSMLVKGKTSYSNTIEKFYIGGDFISNDTLTFVNRMYDVQIGGSLVSRGNINFQNTMDSLVIGSNLVANASFIIGNHTTSKLALNGNFIVFKDAEIKGLSGDNKSNRMRTFMVGGNTSFASWTNTGQVCITY